MVVNGSYGDYLNQLFWTLRYDSLTRVQQRLSNHIMETFKLINIQFYQNVQNTTDSFIGRRIEQII